MNLHPDHQRTPNASLLGAALSVAPAAVGCAVGLLLADRMKSRARHGLASGLFAVGVLAALPAVLDYAGKRLDSPRFQRSRQRRIDCIRDSGSFPDASEEIVGGEEYFLDRQA